jgi:hypothetical protein
VQNAFVRPAIAISYVTSMNRPDAALALAAIHGFETKRQSRAGAICVAGAGLGAAIFCDVVGRFYTAGPLPNANDVLPIGLDLVTPMPPDPPMVRAAIARTNDKGEPAYPRSIRKVTDTSLAEAVLRNGVTLQPDTAFVLSAPATVLARTISLLGVKELFTARVKRLVIVDAGTPQADVPAMRKLLREWPTPVVLCGREVGESLPFPGASLDKDFAWTPAHPVADAYRAFKTMPYDAPSYDLAAVHYASQPQSGFFQLSAPGTVTVNDVGHLTFAPGAGTATTLTVDPSKRAALLQELVALTSAKPMAPTRAGRPAV